ncbi:MAG: NAD(P)/FAD-dependent oxidoreductase [Lachnospiraceae bacterium]|nr:NAD(P)/FAD-dependent oxidoreductase [Lachnospiraceae bacterium]
MQNIIVVGGGPAGMMAAITAAEAGNQVLLIEKNEKLGKKLFITGKGRCNITNNCTNEEFFANIVTNHKFLYRAYLGYDNLKVQEFFAANGLKLKIERGNRIFPVSDHSSDVIAALKKVLTRLGVEILLNTTVTGIKVDDTGIDEKKTEDSIITGVIINNNKYFAADKVIIASGGISYPATGSTGDGLRYAEAAGHKIITPVPALVPLVVKEPWCKELQGLALKNITVVIKAQAKVLYKEFGEMMFTHFGISGPLILSASSFYAKYISKKDTSLITIAIDLKPALSFEQLDKRILRDFEANKNKNIKNILGGLLPAKLHSVIIKLSDLAPDKKINEITKEERQNFVKLLKNLEMTITGSRGFDEAIITQGGINVKDIDPATMESKLVKNLYFAGEMIDTDALTGGYNLQIAWSTGYLAGRGAGGELCE